MLELARLAGFFAAHGIWSVSDGATLVPMLGVERENGERGMTRFALPELGEAAQAGREALAANNEGAMRGVLVVDGYVHLDVGRVDALIVEGVEYGRLGGGGGPERRNGPERTSMTVAVPYRPQPSPGGFAVHRPKFLDISGGNGQPHGLGEAFFEGVDSHEAAKAVWDAHLDESV